MVEPTVWKNPPSLSPEGAGAGAAGAGGGEMSGVCGAVLGCEEPPPKIDWSDIVSSYAVGSWSPKLEDFWATWGRIIFSRDMAGFWVPWRKPKRLLAASIGIWAAPWRMEASWG